MKPAPIRPVGMARAVRRAALPAVALACCLGAAAGARAERVPLVAALDWARLCEGAGTSDAPPRLCDAYLRGYLGPASWLGGVSGGVLGGVVGWLPGSRPYCIPGEVGPEQARRVFLDWSRRFPGRMGRPMASALAAALGEAFPCPGP